MNKLKFWKIETLVEKYFDKYKKEKNFFLKNEIVKKIKQNYFQKDYKKNKISKYNKNFFLVEKFSFEKSKHFVFFGENREKKDNQEEKKKFFGLKKQQLFFQKNKKIYLIDNHNKAMFPFFEIWEGSRKKFDIIHIDAHRDDSKFKEKIKEKISWKNINYFLEKTSVSNYLDLAKKTKLINKILNLTQEKEFKRFLKSKNKNISKNFILNLDIDVFGPEGDYIDIDLKIETIIKAWKKSSVIIIATSPGFIISKDAEKIIKILIKKLIF